MDTEEARRAAQARRDAWWTAKVVNLARYRKEKESRQREVESRPTRPPDQVHQPSSRPDPRR